MGIPRSMIAKAEGVGWVAGEVVSEMCPEY